MPGTVLRFGTFELAVETLELRRSGRKVRLPRQPTRVLCLLATRAGQLVSRQEIKAHLWGVGTFVDAEVGLNHCVNEIRAALRDSASAPRYVETLPRRGYRFVAAVATDGAPAPGPRPRRGVRRDAREAFRRSQQLLREEAPMSGTILPAVERLLEEATRLDPAFADAWGALASNRAWQAFLGLGPHSELLAGAREAARRALALDEEVAGAWAALGVVALYFDWDFPAARERLERALTLYPRASGVRHAYSDYFVVMGRARESHEEVLLARSLWMTGRHEEAVAEMSRQWGAESEAARVLAEALRREGPRGAMKSLGDHLSDPSGGNGVHATEIAACYAIGGDTDAALAWLEKAFAVRAPGLLHVPVDPFFDPIRADPRLGALCLRVGLPVEAWRGAATSTVPPVEPG